MCVFLAEVAEKRVFFRWKWLSIFQVEVAEKCAFFMWKRLKNVRFSGGSG
jgi:hypothetical protein